MKFQKLAVNDLDSIRDIYFEAFPKRERKPFCLLKKSVKNLKVEIFVTMDQAQVLGFLAAIPYRNMVMVDYLAVSNRVRSKGTGSFLLQELCQLYQDRTIVLLIEKLDEHADNSEQRISRKKFYLKNGFVSSGLFVDGTSGMMEILCFGNKIEPKAYLELQEYALGKILFKLSRMHLV